MKRYAYYVVGKKLAIVEKKSEASDWTSPTEAGNATLEISQRAKITSDLAGNSVVSGVIKETHYIQLHDYLCKALVYYLQAKQLEASGEIDGSMYQMKEFYRMIYKYKDGQVSGKRVVFPPSQAII